ncbi:MAG: glycosyltransferase family 9 protein [Plesiomonas sp.]|uniref:glycosyltransferase family 9 protein n=1 Tax=Plesiomonas sp. TaxID=2486279 RepID=UPI003F3A394B
MFGQSSATLPFTSPPRSLCILRLSAIGDVCNAIATVQALQRQWPETKITWIVGKAEAGLLQAISGVEILVLDKKQGWRGYRALYRALHGRNFDALLHMQTALRASIASLLVKTPLRLGFDAIRSADKQHWFINNTVHSPDSPHVLDGFMQFAGTLGITNLTPHWQFTLSPADIQWATAQKTSSPLLVIAPASSKIYKNWTISGYTALAQHALQQGFSVILAGGPGSIDIQLANAIEQAMPANSVHNLTGKTTLLQMLALLQQADIVCSPDSGPAHMAAAIGTPVLGLYAHHNPARTGPYGWQHEVVSHYATDITQQTGKALHELAWRTRLKDPDAMTRLSAEHVITAFDHMVSTYLLSRNT